MADDEKSKSGKLAGGEAVNLAGLVEYAEGGVVSRTLAENKGGTVTLFAFDAEQGLSEHTAPFDALVEVLEGRAELTVGGTAVEAEVGQMVLMPADVPHALKALGRFKMLLTMLKN